MNPVELIRKKRNGDVLSREEMSGFISAYVAGKVPEYQMSAFLMAVYFRGMSREETAAFTDVMLQSGRVIDLSSIPGTKVDKHSTGGVGDKVSLILAPMVAACGVPVPMISGRGLGHTGGTLDKLESIPGFRTNLTIDEYRKVIGQTGLVLSGQTEEVAPADRKMYALRDVTATIESVPLIAGSIMSKKLAEGIDALVLDVKTGNGAFMQRYEDSVELARSLVGIGTSMGKHTIGFITRMDEPLGMAVGNWCEVVESVECLRGKKVPDLMEITYVLGGAMVFLGGRASSIEEGMKACESAIWSGRAYEKFLELVRMQGGDVSYLENPGKYPKPDFSFQVKSVHDGYVIGFETRQIGVLATELGAGRLSVDDTIDPKAGILFKKRAGDRVEKGEILSVIHTDKPPSDKTWEERLAALIAIGPEPPEKKPVVCSIVDAEGEKPWSVVSSQ
jgi:pyrimidine-nucleoside phosphorylase